ncbi:MAG: hypothetical protein U5L72_08200 [Bacteroidales bacterium]|nr:hypothetical protein [Bacteroidales bacterium]
MKYIFLLLLLLITRIGYAQADTTFKPAGNVLVQVINRTLYETSGESYKYGMYINRAHIGYRYQFGPKWSGTVIVDAGRPTVFGNLSVKDTSGNNLQNSYTYKEGSYYAMTLKFSYIEFNPSPQIKLQAGGILQNHYITQEKFWGYRYVLETFNDRYLSIPSADLGFIGYFSPLPWFSFDAALTNGEGFRFNQDSYGKVKYAAGVDIKPVKNWITRFYYDNSTSGDPAMPATQQLLSLFSGYRLPGVFRLGAEYNWHLNHGNLENSDLYGLSVYGSYEMNKSFELFARYDHLRSNKLSGTNDTWHYTDDGKAYIAGIHFIPVSSISLSLSYLGWQPADNSLNFRSAVALSFRIQIVNL